MRQGRLLLGSPEWTVLCWKWGQRIRRWDGWGEVIAVRPQLLHSLWKSGWIPIVASLGVDRSGNRYNVNADTAAGAIARELAAERLILVTDVQGIWRREANSRKLLSRITPGEVREMIRSGEITGGMIPKVKAALTGLETDHFRPVRWP